MTKETEVTDIPPEHMDIVIPAAAGKQTEPVETATENPKDKVLIGGKVFDSQEAAEAHLNDLERQRAEAVAYARGLKEAINPVNQATKEAGIDENYMKEFEAKFFENPVKTMMDFKQEIVAQTVNQVMQHQNLMQDKQSVWADFYSKNPELNSPAKRKVFESYARELARDPAYSGLEFADGLAKAGNLFKSVFVSEKSLPKANTSFTPATVVGSGKKEEPEQNEALDFASQIKQAQRRGRK
jgi:hypothetical protein